MKSLQKGEFVGLNCFKELKIFWLLPLTIVVFRLAQRRRNQPLRGRPPANRKVDPAAAANTEGVDTPHVFATPSVDSILNRKRMAAWAERVSSLLSNLIHSKLTPANLISPLFFHFVVKRTNEETKSDRMKILVTSTSLYIYLKYHPQSFLEKMHIYQETLFFLSGIIYKVM